MKVIKAKNIGACFGVKNAIIITENALKEKIRPVQFLGSLVHNEKIVEKFLKKKVLFKKNLKEIKSGALIIQAHGCPPFYIDPNENILIKDATCPLVKKVQKLAKQLSEQGYQVIIIGDKNHSEVKGIKGYAGYNSFIIENKKQAEQLFNIKNKKLALICQTTQNLTNVNEILKTLKKKNNKIKFCNTICPEVKIRQLTAKQIARQVNQVLIIGSKTSANTKRLYEISRKSAKLIYWINSLKELKKLKINKSLPIGLISGTSADDLEIEKIKNYLSKL